MRVRHLGSTGNRRQALLSDMSMLPAAAAAHAQARSDVPWLEGHVPAAGIRRLLKERPRAIGVAVPGMPIGSPGTYGPACGGRKEPCDVLLVAADGHATTHQPHH